MRRRLLERGMTLRRRLGLLWPTAQMFSSRMVGQAASFLVSILVARLLGPQDFGLYSFALIAAMLLSEIPGVGLDLSAVRLSARDWVAQPARARSVLVIASLTKAVVGLALLLLAVSLVDPIVGRRLGQPELILPIRWAAVAAVGLGMTEFMIASLQAREQFGRVLAVNVALAVVRLGPIALLAAAGRLTLVAALLAFTIAAYVGCGLSAWAAWRAWAGTTHWAAETMRELFVFARWFILATLVGVMTNSLDVLALGHLAGPQPTGIYAAARTLALPLAVAAPALGAVLLPRFSRLAVQGRLGPYVRSVSRRVTIVTLVGAGAVVVVAPLIVRLVYGEQYADTSRVFQVLALAYSAQIMTWPALALLMAVDRPRIIALLSLVQLVGVAVGYRLVAPVWGAVGVAIVYCAGCGLVLVPYALTTWLTLRRLGQTDVPLVGLRVAPVEKPSP